MKTKAVRMYGEMDLRLEEFELPSIKEDEILVKVISDSICMSTYKLVQQGKRHKRASQNIDTNPIIVGHEFAGVIVKVGDKWKEQFKPGQRFAQQSALNYKGSLASPGYSYEYFGGACTYCIIPNEVMELGCLMNYDGESFFEASLGEPMSCIIGGYHANYHANKKNYNHEMGTKKDGNIITPEYAADHGAELLYVNTAKMDDPVKELMEISEGHGYDDLIEANELSAKGVIEPAVMVTHVGGSTALQMQP